MTTSDFRIVPASADLVETYYGGRVPYTIRGFVALLREQPAGVGGIEFIDGMPIAFSEMTDELRVRRRDCARCYRALEPLLRGFGGVLYAVACEPSSRPLLKRLGFREAGAVVAFGRAHGPLMVRS